MRNFVLGIIVGVVLFAGGGLLYAYSGLMRFTADQRPGALETSTASRALDNAMEHQAPRVESPLQATDSNLIDGMRFYIMNCAGCHGGVDKKPAEFGLSFYPPAPQLIIHPPDDPEWHIFFAIKHGVRWTGMPAWGKTVKDDDLWKTTMFLSRVEKLPPAVQRLIR
jgi:mono/diheme cytochrome c family protein